MLDPRKSVRASFENVWAAMKSESPDSDPNINPVAKWWPTITEQAQPDYDMLTNYMLNFTISPYECMLSVFWHGYIQALDDVMLERIHPETAGQEDRVPQWLDALVLEDLAKRFSDKH